MMRFLEISVALFVLCMAGARVEARNSKLNYSKLFWLACD